MPRTDRLSALDAAFLDLDTAAAPLQVGWVLRLDGRPPSLDALRAHVAARLDRVPRFRRRVVRPPLGLGDPIWADDPGFDVADHVVAARLSAPGGPAELRELAGQILSRPLDPRRALWRMTLVDGLAAGGFALVGQAHHALVDGVAAVEVAMLLFDVEGMPSELPVPSAWTPEPGPSAPVAAAAVALARTRAAMRGTRALARAMRRADPAALRDVRVAVEQIARPAPPTAFDHSAGPQRLVAFAETSLDDARAAGRRHGATLNDMLLAAATIAFGRALRRRGERPAWLKVLVPVDVRTDGEAAPGNKISFMTAELPVALSDPVEILRSVRAQTMARKAAGAAAPLDALARAGEILPGTARRIVARAAAGAASFNAIVSNIPGPPVTLTLLGRPLAAVFPAVPMLEGHGVSIGALSYRGRLQACVYADAAVVPDAVDVARDLEQAFDALRAPPPPVETPWRTRARSRRDRRQPAAASRYTAPPSDTT